jgi:hypothetical protein
MRRDSIPSIFADPKLGGHARRMMRQYESLFEGQPELAALRLLGLFDHPAGGDALRILRRPPGISGVSSADLTQDEWATVLENLRDARLIQFADPEGDVDCHPLVREHFRDLMSRSDREAFLQAHSLLFEHYRDRAPRQPETLDAMTPLFDAVYHGCAAERYNEAWDVYFDRIRRTNDAYLTKHLGAFGANLDFPCGRSAGFPRPPRPFRPPSKMPSAIRTG